MSLVNRAANGEIFMQSDYLGLAINAQGTIGSRYNAPSGFYTDASHGYIRLGIYADSDGFGVGKDTGMRDAVLPGTAIETFSIGFKKAGVTEVWTNSGLDGRRDITGTATNTSTASAAQATWTGATDTKLGVKQVVTLTEDGKYAMFEVTLTNNTGANLTDLRYLRSIDPDMNPDSYSTNNTIVSQGKGGSLVTAGGSPTGEKLFLYANDDRASVSIYGFENFTPFDGNVLKILAAGTSKSADVSLNLNFNIGDLAAGQSTKLTFYLGMTNDLSGTIDAIKTGAPPPPPPVDPGPTPTNHAPAATADAFAVDNGKTVAGNVLKNDGDVDGDSLTASVVNGPAHGALKLNADGSFSYTADAGFSGKDSFTYKASDGSLSSNATVTINVNGTPDAVDDSRDINEGTSASGNVLANDTDPDGQNLSATLVSGPSNGTLKLSADGTFNYTPNAGFYGTDSFVYKASDGSLSDQATVTIDINGRPVAVAESFDTVGTAQVSGNVLLNDYDPDGDAIWSGLITDVKHGTLKLNADGTFTYQADAGFVGTDSFVYKAGDFRINSTATVTIVVGATNTAPDAVNDSKTVIAGTAATGNVLANDTDPNGDALSASLVSGPAHGTLTLKANGTYVYTADANYSGADSFVYKASDGKASDNATVTLTVNPAPVLNAAPVAVADSFSVVSGKGATGNVLANDTDANGDTLSASLVTGPAHGTLTLKADGSYNYVADAGYTGTDSFTYKASDGSLWSNASVSIKVQAPPNTAPVAVGDKASVESGKSVSGNVLVNDSDPDGDALAAALVSGPAHGTIKVNADGSFIYTADVGFSGTDSFTYAASDGKASSNAVVNIDVAAPPSTEPPVTSILDKPGLIDLSPAASQYVSGPGYHNVFYVETDRYTGKDTVTNFSARDVLVLNNALYDSNNDGFIWFSKSTLDVDGKSGNDTVKLTGVSVLRDMGSIDGLAVYANGKIRPNGAIESKLGDEVLSGDQPDNSRQTFFFDTGLDLDLGNDQIVNFGSKDLIVTTSALKLTEGTNHVDFGGDDLVDFIGGKNAPDDTLTPGEAGHLLITDTDGAHVTGLEYDGMVSGNGINYFVYSMVGSAVGTGNLNV